MASFTSTLLALIAPRRSIPIAGVVAALAAVQLHYGGALDVVVPIGMSLAFVALAPWSWRVLLARGLTLPRAAAFAIEAVAVVAVVGIAVPRALNLGPTFLGDEGSLVIAGVLYVVGGWGLGRDIELELDVEHAQLKAIRAHLDPHFLYNTLNAIAEWCAEDPKVAEEATLQLATLLRSTLDALELRRWPLARELALVEDLLALHRMRDPAAFTSALELEPAAAGVELPPLIVVALVENAVKHGPRAGHRGPIAIRVRPTERGLRCEVENPGPYAPGTGGRGLATLRARLALAYGRRATFAIAATTVDRTRAVLELGRLAS
jgi:two-component system, LytTR family, sensor histidine kinase AlgZ